MYIWYQRGGGREQWIRTQSRAREKSVFISPEAHLLRPLFASNIEIFESRLNIPN